MNLRSLSLAVATLVMALPAVEAWAQAEHADRMAAEIALKRAQIRAAAQCDRDHRLTTQQMPAVPRPEHAQPPQYPTTGTAGPVPVPGRCGR
jgi:hypothetical protein